MAVPKAAAFAAPLVAVLAGCAGTPPTEDSRAVWRVDERANRDDWFCEPAGPAGNGGWDCVRDPERIANPRPARLPTPLFPVAGTTKQTRHPSNAVGALAGQPGRAPDQVTPDDPAIPLYQQLSHRPNQSTDLTDLPGSYYVIQLIALSPREDLEQYIVDNSLPVMSHAVVAKDGERFHALLAGIYRDRETAERAVRHLPEEFIAQGPWVRSMESLQAAMARAEELRKDP